MRRGNTLIPAVIVILAIAAFVGVLYFAFWPKTQQLNPGTMPFHRLPNINAVSNTSIANSNTPEVSPAKTLSPGLWFPFNDKATINNPRPVIYGKVSQSDQIFLKTTFGQTTWPGRDFGQAKFLTFKPGVPTNLAITLDNQKVNSVSGFAQFPSIVCSKENISSDGSLGEPTLYKDTAECTKALSAKLPPLIFVFRPAADLSNGQHTLTVNGTEMTFTVDSSSMIAAQKMISIANKQEYYKFLDMADDCSPGYFQDPESFPFALPVPKNNNLFYGLSFPQSESEKGSIQRRGVSLSLSGRIFPIFFPDSSTFYGKLVGQQGGRGDNGLFLPMKNLVYSDGKPATVWALGPIDPHYASTSGYYSELFPVDISGRTYRGNSIPWIMSNSSGCDG